MASHAFQQYEDETIQCVSCSHTFVFSAREQQVFDKKGYRNKPKRCPTCRRKRNQQSTEETRISDTDVLREICKAVGETRIMIEREFKKINQRIDEMESRDVQA